MKLFQFINKSLKIKVTAFIVGIIAFALLITCVMTFGTVHKATQEDSNILMTSIASNRKGALEIWFDNCWSDMKIASGEVKEKMDEAVTTSHLMATLVFLKTGNKDFSELFVVNKDGAVIASTYEKQIGKDLSSYDYVKAGLTGDNFLAGPYVDEVTGEIGSSSSSFIDEVTLMFSTPVKSADGRITGVLCGRMPNDVLGDLLQNESSHIYKESGDNYIYMIKSASGVLPGTCISRSRFEDNSIVDGPNLKEGITIGKGVTFKIEKHTEFELRFSDPETGELTKGVAQTIDKGTYFMTWPGYPDYRGVRVAGKSFTINPPYSPDTWGLMCEANINEVFKNIIIAKRYSILVGIASIIIFGYLAYYMLNRIIVKPVLKISNKISNEIAEGGGNLALRLEEDRVDEIGVLAKQFNSFLENIHGAISDFKKASMQVNSSAREISASIKEQASITAEQSSSVSEITATMEELTATSTQIAENSNQVVDISSKALGDSERGAHAVQDIMQKIDEIHDDNQRGVKEIIELGNKSKEIAKVMEIINNIADQTKLIAFNAAIEASSAGEAGKRFSVVAGEIRRLADNVMESTNEIENRVSEIQDAINQQIINAENGSKKIDEGITSAADTVGMLGEILTGAQSTNDAAKQISLSTQQQKTASNQVVTALKEISDGAKQSSEALRHTNTITDDLANLSDGLTKLIDIFKI